MKFFSFRVIFFFEYYAENNRITGSACKARKEIEQTMKFRLLWISLLLLCIAQNGLFAQTAIINSSRANAVRVNVPSLKSSGTGFFFDTEHIITAFHVVGTMNVNKNTKPPEAEITIGSDVVVVLPALLPQNHKRAPSK